MNVFFEIFFRVQKPGNVVDPVPAGGKKRFLSTVQHWDKRLYGQFRLSWSYAV